MKQSVFVFVILLLVSGDIYQWMISGQSLKFNCGLVSPSSSSREVRQWEAHWKINYCNTQLQLNKQATFLCVLDTRCPTTCILVATKTEILTFACPGGISANKQTQNHFQCYTTSYWLYLSIILICVGIVNMNVNGIVERFCCYVSWFGNMSLQCCFKMNANTKIFSLLTTILHVFVMFILRRF